jgi:hypothetical protein
MNIIRIIMDILKQTTISSRTIRLQVNGFSDQMLRIKDTTGSLIFTGSTLSARYCEVKVKAQQKDVNSYELRNTLEYGTRIFTGTGNTVGTLKRAFPDKPSPVKGFR